MNPWGIHTIADIYHPDVTTGLPDGRWVAAVAEPYTGNRFTAAWWVLTGRAYAFRWPRHGDLEAIWRREPSRVGQKPRPFVPVAATQTKGEPT